MVFLRWNSGKMGRKNIIFFFILIACNALYAQQNEFLYSETDTIFSDSATAIILYTKARILFEQDSLDEALNWANQSLKFALRTENKNIEAPDLILIANIYSKTGLTEKAIPYYLRAANILEGQQDSSALQIIYSAIADDYYKVKVFEKSGEYYKKALLYTNTNNINNRSELFENIGDAFYLEEKYDSAIIFFKKLLTLQQQSGNEDIKPLYFLVRSYNKKKDYQSGLKYNLILFERYEAKNNLSQMSTSKNNIGYNYIQLADYDKAAESYIESIKYGEEAGINENDKALLLSNIGICYQNLKDFNQAIQYFQDALTIFKKTGIYSEKARIENILAVLYFDKGDLYNAGFFSRNSIESAKKANDYKILAICYYAYSNILQEGNDYIKALEYYEKHLSVRDSLLVEKKLQETELTNRKLQLERSEKELRLKLKEEEMKELTIKQLTLQLEKEAGEKDLLRTEMEVEQLEKEKLQQSLKITRQQHKADQMEKETQLLEQQNRIKDLKIEQEERIQREQEREIELLERQKQLDRLKIDKQETARKTLLGTIVLVIAIATIILISLLLTRKKNILLAKQKVEIENKNTDLEKKNIEISTQKDEIEVQHKQLFIQKEKIQEINREITDSIEYAERIQMSALPDKSILEKNVRDFFIFFRPKNIVSGDFYWFAPIENHTVITVADCTGHGVPGAFMSMLGISFLKEIVVKGYVTHPAVILKKLRKEVINALNQRGIYGEQRDGMDMALISLDNKTNTIQFAGAYNPLYILRENGHTTPKQFKDFAFMKGKTHTLYEVKGNKMPIAIYEKMDEFTNHEIKLKKGDLLYMFSDGYADQFGGPKSKKFKYKPFKELILNIAGQPMKEQEKILDKTFVEWKGDLEQIDDICIVGLQI